MDITFVITNYNYGRYLPRLMQSIAALNGRENHCLNLIIGDDASTDDSDLFVEQAEKHYSHIFKDVKIIRNPSNGGKNSLLNQMLPLIQTEYSIIIDADDWLHPEYIDRTSTVFMGHVDETDLGFVYSDCTLCNDTEEVIGNGKSTEFSRELLKTHSYIPQTCLIRTKALQSCLPLDETVRVGTKHHQWNKICDQGWRGIRIAEPLFFYRMHDKNISAIGQKVLSEARNDTKDRILYGYWPTAASSVPLEEKAGAPIISHGKSEKYRDSLRGVLAGAAHYNFRDAWHPKDLVFSHGSGARLVDLDGNEYLDFYSNFGSNILGHCHPDYISAVFREVSKISSNSLSDLSLEVSQKICDVLPSAEMVRFSVTGTEAVQTALRVARAYTGKQKFIRFNGNYHGHSDNMLGGKPSNDDCPHPIDFSGDSRASKGLALGVRETQSILLPWNDLSYLEDILQRYHQDIACIITEPLAVNGGGIEPLPGYLEGMRALCDEYKVVLIFDEIITGFRVDLGGAQKLYGVTPDLTTLGKAMGGGMMPVSAIAGKKEIMTLMAEREVVHAGTFNGYHAGLAAIHATLNILQEEESSLAKVAKNGCRFQEIMKNAAHDHDVPLIMHSHPSCFYVHVTDKKLRSAEEWTAKIKTLDAHLQKALIECGIILAPISRGYPSVSFTDQDAELFAERSNAAFQKFNKEHSHEL